MKTTLPWHLVLLIGITSLLYSCKKTETPAIEAYKTNLQIHVSHRVGGLNLFYDTIKYTNLAGNKYSLTLLEYYISEISLRKEDNSFVKCKGSFYINPRLNQVNIQLSGMAPGKYTGLKFYIGIPPENNVFGALEATTENTNMQWPEPLGGGYHFLKMEGRYIDSTNQARGFAMHLGSNEMLIQHQIIPVNLEVNEQNICFTNLVMDVNEWFKSPYTYNFERDGNYTMAITPLMQLLKNNGYDVFSKPE